MLVAGAYYADLGKFRRSNIVRMPDGTMRMSWKRSKTGRETWMAVTEELMQCATGDGDQLFPCLPWSIVYFNIQLKQWAFKAGLVRDGLPLQLSQKWARKTCGNNARQLTNDPFVLRDLMAHKELKVYPTLCATERRRSHKDERFMDAQSVQGCTRKNT